jgi:hypothetical protein
MEESLTSMVVVVVNFAYSLKNIECVRPFDVVFWQ